MKLGKFNANDHEEMMNFDQIPAGQYVGRITESKEIQNKNKTGHYLKLTFKISEGKYKDRLLWVNLNLDHPTAKVVEIANRELATIMKSCGKVSVDDSEDLHGIDMELKVTEKDATANFSASNEIKGYKPLAGVARPGDSAKSEEAEPKKKKRVSFGDD